MPRGLRNLVNSEKKEITWSDLGINAATTTEKTIYQGEPPSATNLGNEVEVGSLVKWVYFEFHFSQDQTANVSVVHWQIDFIPEGMTTGNPNTYNQGNKAYIIKRGMEMLPVNVSTVFKRIFVVKIPRVYQRVKVNTALKFRYISSSANTINACGFAVYKRYK